MRIFKKIRFFHYPHPLLPNINSFWESEELAKMNELILLSNIPLIQIAVELKLTLLQDVHRDQQTNILCIIGIINNAL